MIFSSDIAWTGEPWIIAEWPDGTWCNQDEIPEYLTFQSDDYQLSMVLRFDPDGYFPTKTERIHGPLSRLS